MHAFDAIILCGGQSERMGGQDKCLLEIDGVTLLDRSIAAAGAARRIVGVGTPRPAAREIDWTSEDPPGGGPVAALAAGLKALGETSSDYLLLLAADLPFAGSAIERLLTHEQAADVAGTLAVDPDGRDQYLLSVWQTERLRTGFASYTNALASPRNLSMHGLLDHLLVERIAVTARESLDCDTAEDLHRALSS